MTTLRTALKVPAAMLELQGAMSPSALGASDTTDQVLMIADTGQSIELIVPAGGFWLVIPKQDFVVNAPKISGAPGPRYFELVDRGRRIEVSGWFEAAELFPGVT